MVIAAIWITLAGLVLVLLYRAGESSGFFVVLQTQVNAWLSALHTQISIWLSVLPEGLLENVFFGFVIASLITLWLAFSEYTDFRARTRLIMIAGALAINLASGVLLACSPARAKPKTPFTTGAS
jgi:hypothetical protein